jgi:hypothetical protein
MRYEINEHEPDVEIHVSGAAGRSTQLLESMRECQAGHCGCPTDQYDKLAAIDVHADEEEITLRLHPLPGQRLDPEQLRACLDYTTTNAEE